MSGLDKIGIKVVSEQDVAQSGNAVAILHEISEMLDELVEEDESSAIDLQSLPLTPGDYELLREVLAEGEVVATIDAIGPTEVRETVYPGVWWITHYNVEGDIVADVIEVGFVPEILKSHPDDVSDARDRLKAFLQEAGPATE